MDDVTHVGSQASNLAAEARCSVGVMALSIQAMAWAIQQQDVTEPVTRFVLLCMANYAGADGNGACPAVLRLALDTGLSERAVRLHIRKLEAAGVIVRGNQAFAAAKIRDPRYRPIVYNLLTIRGAHDAPLAVEGGTRRRQGGHATTSRGAPRAPNPKDLSEGEPKSVEIDVSEARKAATEQIRKLADQLRTTSSSPPKRLAK